MYIFLLDYVALSGIWDWYSLVSIGRFSLCREWRTRVPNNTRGTKHSSVQRKPFSNISWRQTWLATTIPGWCPVRCRCLRIHPTGIFSFYVWHTYRWPLRNNNWWHCLLRRRAIFLGQTGLFVPMEFIAMYCGASCRLHHQNNTFYTTRI